LVMNEFTDSESGTLGGFPASRDGLRSAKPSSVHAYVRRCEVGCAPRGGDAQFATTPAAVELFSSHAFLPELHSTGALVAPPALLGEPGTPPIATSRTTVVRLSGASPRERTITEPLVSTVNLPRRQSAVSLRIQTV